MDTLHNPQAAPMRPQVKTWDELAQAAYYAYAKNARHLGSWSDLDHVTQACWLAVVHQLLAEYVALRAFTAQQFHLGAGDCA